ncbi:MAG: protein-disulfide reductase DsbD N-terminal domain-containing protein [Desulfarculaceae bacterium]|jgi:DsbC/DsbD-like thiol-disulfide interchange protein
MTQKPCFHLLFFALTILGILSAIPAWAQPKELVQVEVLHSRDAYPQGSSHALALRLRIAPGYHINSNQPQDDSLIPTKLKFHSPPGLRLGEPKFPQPKMHKPAFLPQAVPVYGGTLVIRTRVTVGAQTKPGQYRAQALVSFQGCNDQMCLMPQEITATIPISVVPASAKTKPLNQDIFKSD